MLTASEIVAHIGRKELAKAADIGLTAISNAVVAGQLPASWYEACQSLLAKQGLECPTGPFNMRRPPNVDGGPAVQAAQARDQDFVTPQPSSRASA